MGIEKLHGSMEGVRLGWGEREMECACFDVDLM